MLSSDSCVEHLLFTQSWLPNCNIYLIYIQISSAQVFTAQNRPKEAVGVVRRHHPNDCCSLEDSYRAPGKIGSWRTKRYNTFISMPLSFHVVIVCSQLVWSGWAEWPHAPSRETQYGLPSLKHDQLSGEIRTHRATFLKYNMTEQTNPEALNRQI